MMKRLTSILGLLLFLFSHHSIAQNGHLMIVGGALEDTTQSVYKRMLELAGGPEHAKIAIIPTASGYATTGPLAFANNCIKYGALPWNCEIIPIACVDDPDTKEVDESTWANNASNPDIINRIRESNLVWFTGGDQMRTMKLLFNDGKPSPAYEAVVEVLNRGGVVAGSSAGAAIQSLIMIGGGNSIGAITNGLATSIEQTDDTKHEGIYLTKGCGFFPFGIVDQHFSQRSRLGRLTLAAWLNKDKWSQAIGIDENTALEVDLKKGTAKVWGQNHVLVIDLEKAKGNKTDQGYAFKDVTLSLLQQGDEIDLLNKVITIAKDKSLLKKSQTKDSFTWRQSGVMGGDGYTLLDMIESIIKNRLQTETLSNLTILDSEKAIQFVLKSSEGTSLYESDKQNSRFSVTHLLFDITPKKITISK